MSDFNILTVFILAWFIFAPIYLFYRIKITRNHEDRHLSYYTKRRIFNVTSIELFIVIVGLIILSSLLIAIKARENLFVFNNYEVGIFIAFFVLCITVAFGVGSYVTSIITEQYTLKDLKNHSSFNTLFLVNEFYHGPVSHVLMFSSGITLFFLIALLEYFNPIKYVSPILLFSYFIYGIFFGLGFFVSQIQSQTWKHQISVVILVNIAEAYFVISQKVNFWKMPYNLFFLTAISVFSLGLTIFYIHHKVKHTVYRYD